MGIPYQRQNCRRVSIPFKREKAFQAEQLGIVITTFTGVSIPFKREKAFQAQAPAPCPYSGGYRVSIPFKREKAFQANKEHPMNHAQRKFQFPSNGKAYRKLTWNPK